MNFEPLCSLSEASKPGMSEIALTISTAVLEAFSGYVIPHRTVKHQKFTDEDCEFYVNKRDWIAKIPKQENLSYQKGQTR